MKKTAYTTVETNLTVSAEALEAIGGHLFILALALTFAVLLKICFLFVR